MNDLTENQIEAVNKDGLSVLSAGPGSGKTRVVAHRVKRIINEKKLVSYQGVAALSFTNVAKDSVLNEYERITRKHITSPHFIGTIDSFLNNVLFRPFAHKVVNNGNKEIKILDIHSTWLKDCYPKYGLNGQNIVYDKNGQILYQKAKLSDPNKQQYIEYVKKDSLKKNIVTQSDVNYFCLKILKNNPNVIKALIDRFPYIIIDEAQDCSDVQMAIIDTLVNSSHKEIMLVGDPYQAIYEWRDANPQLFIDKENNNDWQSLQLLESHRSGPKICTFLNLFHNEREVTHNPKLTEIADAEVKIIHSDKIEKIITQYLKQVESSGIEPNVNDVAVLYGGHKSRINLRKTLIDPVNLWKTQDSGLKNIQKVYALPLNSKIAITEKNYKKAYEYVEKFFYYLSERKHLVSREDINKHRLGDIESRIILWNFCKQLPSLDKNLDDWINETNELVKIAALELGITNVLEIKKKTNQQNKNLKKLLFKESSDELSINSFTLENIHQIKGRTFESVMIYVDSGSGNYKISINKLKEIIQHKDLFKGKHHEDGRCFYVAASRARRLLCISSVDEAIKTLFEPFKAGPEVRVTS